MMEESVRNQRDSNKSLGAVVKGEGNLVMPALHCMSHMHWASSFCAVNLSSRLPDSDLHPLESSAQLCRRSMHYDSDPIGQKAKVAGTAIALSSIVVLSQARVRWPTRERVCPFVLQWLSSKSHLIATRDVHRCVAWTKSPRGKADCL